MANRYSVVARHCASSGLVARASLVVWVIGSIRATLGLLQYQVFPTLLLPVVVARCGGLAGHLVDALDDAVAVQGAERDGLQDEHVERALQKVQT